MKIDIVVPVSGGKDSQACLKLAIEKHGSDKVLGLFCDTQFEHPLTYQHVDKMKELYGVNIERICLGSVPDVVRRYKRFPGGGARHCTKELKIIPSKRWYVDFAKKNGGFDVWYGMRGGESNARMKRYSDKVSMERYPPNDVLADYPKSLHKNGVCFVLPILDWSESNVFDFLDGHENPLYRMGEKRVGCFPCLAGGDASKEHSFNMDEFGRQQREVVRVLEGELGRSIWTSKGGWLRNEAPQLDFGGCSFCSM
ncbi:phosphoadenosine phosphosulfate reductase family protein [Candidatus Thiothrix sp. Deng01]|uniref:Phosphoadenosine phosphosulfate reductase family protein n=1 Tax=Candidatus Thiothrix phosphatis TaxID=3112415 RepID=A0ABU6CU07_9GAMM|nr:phosphoadenosine phosphosulfate reductase family protein [Candidatus Thiothrix sp. Deng01]MEB4589997.1 phosphoadenosine phosphosulfate reductase family protein [Candidatus Thiothrix sp. Deng01]